ncbi:MAG: hypothetical protein IKL01_06450, partial [Mailhella sp.]|nr:hypothetical protein [Mailhella sp.]
PAMDAAGESASMPARSMRRKRRGISMVSLAFYRNGGKPLMAGKGKWAAEAAHDIVNGPSSAGS